MPGETTMNAHQNDTPILRAEHFSKTLGGRKILDDCSISMHPGDVKVLIGPSGAGKSTFLQCINCLIEPDEGEIWLGDNKIDFRNTKELCKLRERVGMIFQDFNLFDHLCAEDNVALALRKVRGMNKAEALERARKELARVGLAERAKLYPAQLSGGQKQRVAIARIFLKNPPILILDEATSALDSVTEAKIQRAFDHLAVGRTTLIIAHRLSTIRSAHRIVSIADGYITECGTHAELLEKGGIYAELYRTQNALALEAMK